MAGRSIYEIDGYQDYAKPSWVIDEPNYYLQDVFHMTRPEVFNLNRDPDEETNPYYQNYRNDEQVKYREKDEFRYNYQPQKILNDDDDKGYFISPKYKKKSYDVNNVISLYRLENYPQEVDFEGIKQGAYKISTSLSELVRMTHRVHIDPKTKKNRFSKCTARLVRGDPKNNSWTYKVVCREKYSDPKGHTVNVVLYPEKAERDITRIPVKVSCSCPYWKWWGPDFNAYREDYLEEDSRPKSDRSSPDVRDPGRHHKICKHVYAVGIIFKRFVTKKDLDTFKDVNDIQKLLEQESDREWIENITEITEHMHDKEKREMNKVIEKWKRMPSKTNRNNIRDKFIDILKNEDDKFLDNALKIIKRPAMKRKRPAKPRRKSSIRTASVQSVLALYISEILEA